MTNNLISMASLAGDPGFGNRVQAAMVSAALTVVGETVGTTGPDPNGAIYQLRHTLATGILNNASGYLNRFTWAAAVSPAVAGDVGLPLSIISSSATNPATVVTSANTLSTGQFVEITGHSANTSINGTWPVTVVSSTVMTIPVLGIATGGATGMVTLQPPDADIETAVDNSFSGIAGVGAVTG
jgi:hypothetical protein